jgi:5-methylcytosine-specific restriction protein A
MPCPRHERERRRFWDAHRDQATRSLYTRQWAAYSKARLAEYPLCADPFGNHAPRIVAATVTDHIVPHQGDRERFWNPTNHQSLCKACHDAKTALEDGGFGNPTRGAKRWG